MPAATIVIASPFDRHPHQSRTMRPRKLIGPGIGHLCSQGPGLPRLSGVVTCPRCGEDNVDRAKFCLNCGASLGPEEGPVQERKLVSVLFVDLVGFTARSDRADPEDVREMLEGYYARSKEQLERFGGR